MVKNPMMQGVQNPEIMYRSDPLPEEMRARLRELGYAPEVTRLLMEGLPIVYSDHGTVVEYPDGRRIEVQQYKVYDDQGEFQRYRYRILGERPRAAR